MILVAASLWVTLGNPQNRVLGAVPRQGPGLQAICSSQMRSRTVGQSGRSKDSSGTLRRNWTEWLEQRQFGDTDSHGRPLFQHSCPVTTVQQGPSGTSDTEAGQASVGRLSCAPWSIRPPLPWCQNHPLLHPLVTSAPLLPHEIQRLTSHCSVCSQARCLEGPGRRVEAGLL